MPITSLSSVEFADLAPLGARLEGVRIVQIGESSHGAAEFNRLKTRLVRYLHEEQGFNVLAFESDIYQCARANAGAATAPARSTMTSCIYGVWHTEEVVQLFEYIRATRSTSRPLVLAGYDIQPIGPNKEDRPNYLARVVAAIDPALAERVRVMDRAYLDAYATSSRERRAYFRNNREALIARYTELYDFLVANEPDLMRMFASDRDPLAPLFAQQTAWTVRQYVLQQTAATDREYNEIRDFGMAETLTFLAESVYPDARIIAWTHNAHAQHSAETIDLTGIEEPTVASRAAGGWLHERYGDRLFTIGLYAVAGATTRNDRSVTPVTPVRPGSLEAQRFPADAPAALFLSPRNGASDQLWTQPTTAKYWGAADVPMTLSEQYDAVVLVRSVSPPAYIN